SMPEILPSPDAEPFAPMAETHSDDASAMAAVADPVPEEPVVSVPVEDVEVSGVSAVDFDTVDEPALPEETPDETDRGAVVAGLATAAAASLASQDAPETSAMPDAGELAAGELTDDLTRIRGVDQDTEAKLNEAGVFRFDQLSRLTADDVSSLHGAIGSSSRISREGWIEQATILERGEETYFSRRQHQQAPKSNPETPSTTASEVRSGTGDAPTAVAAAGGFAVAASPAPVEEVQETRVDPEPEPHQDGQDGGGGGTLPRDPAAHEARDTRETGGAREPDDMREPRDEPVSREVRTKRMLPPRPGRVIGAGAQGGGQRVQSSQPDDLKRIRGIGIVIEKKLNAMGVTSYQQIADWTDDDIAQVNHILDFSGRIERENWIEQARILSGNTGA
ncbi:MAG: hypothetical protein ACR2O4_01655, partial [Hyphomicrobiaceae bacterium]